jgi:hypothetical protein
MNAALQEGSTDIIGLARPLCSAPYFCKEIISGKITKAKDNKVVSTPRRFGGPFASFCVKGVALTRWHLPFFSWLQNPSYQTGTSVFEIGCIARKEPIPDLSDEKIAEETLAIVLGKKVPGKEKPVEDQNTKSYGGAEEKSNL